MAKRIALSREKDTFLFDNIEGDLWLVHPHHNIIHDLELTFIRFGRKHRILRVGSEFLGKTIAALFKSKKQIFIRFS